MTTLFFNSSISIFEMQLNKYNKIFKISNDNTKASKRGGG